MAKNATSEVLNSFKSLTSMFKTVHQLIKYLFSFTSVTMRSITK